ncbi:hypothetical protein CPC16_011953, partial [Podila verticillata]
MSTCSPCEDKSTTFTGWACPGFPTLKPYDGLPRPSAPRTLRSRSPTAAAAAIVTAAALATPDV